MPTRTVSSPAKLSISLLKEKNHLRLSGLKKLPTPSRMVWAVLLSWYIHELDLLKAAA
jgi:hypothetical protein